MFAKWTSTIFDHYVSLQNKQVSHVFNYFSNHMVRFFLWCSKDTHRPCLIFRDGTVGLSGFHLKFGPRIISSFSWLKMTRIHLGFANDQLQLDFGIKNKGRLSKNEEEVFLLLCFLIFRTELIIFSWTK